MVSRIFASWNQLDRWLRQVEGGPEARGVATSGRVAGRHPGLTDAGTGTLIVVNRATVCLIPARSRVGFSTIRRVPQ